ncbi:hypothetical protein WJX72_011947 [[Myrmecia] bisecta]|uniref:Uncharacterized protein n=1 Tax=[Myrmecia] bisecta TaxID=41462 RepID=A0AAW1R9H9_9CHLO
MEELKKQILGLRDWDASKKGRALNRLKGENLKRFTGLPDDVLQAALDDELSAGKSSLYEVIHAWGLPSETVQRLQGETGCLTARSTEAPAWQRMTGCTVKVSDRCIHMIPKANLDRSHYDFASKYVADAVITNLLAGSRRDLELFLVTSRDIPLLAMLRERLFEAFVLHIRPLGGKFDSRDLQNGEVCVLKETRSGVYYYDDLAEVETQPDGVYCIPVSKTAEAIDYICQPDDLGQITINLKHGAKTTDL